MPLIDLYSNEFKRRNEGHFASIVRVALHDGKIGEQEQDFLDHLAVNLQISEAKYKEILSNPEVHPVNPPIAHEKRVERLYDLSRVIHLNKNMSRKIRENILRKFVVALGFCSCDVEFLIEKIFQLLSQDADFNTFQKSIGKVGSDSKID